MTKITSYPQGILYLNDYLIGIDRDASATGVTSNVTRNFLVSEIVNIIIASLGKGSVTSISTASSAYVNVTGGPITTTGTITANLSATGTSNTTTFLRGDDIWSLPGPTPNSVSILSNGTELTTTVSSIDCVGGALATAAILNVTINIPSAAESDTDNVIAGTAISVDTPTGNVTVTNTGVVLGRAGGNITLSGGTGDVTISTTANAGTVGALTAGLGIATITNNTSNPEIDLEFTGINNYISRSSDTDVIKTQDSIEFNQISSSSVKAVEIGQIPIGVLTVVDKYIDDADKDKLTNTTDNLTSTQITKKMVSLTGAEYGVLLNGATIDENTLYFIIGAGVSITVNPDVTAIISGDAGFTGPTTSPSSFSGTVGTPYTFTTTLGLGSPAGTFSGTNPVITSGVINNSSGNPYNQAITISGTYTAPVLNSVRAVLSVLLDQDSSGSVGGSNLAANSANLTYSGSTTGSQTPITGGTFSTSTINYDFGTQSPGAPLVSITDTNTYEFVQPSPFGALSNPYTDAPSGSATPTFPQETVQVTAYIIGQIQLKEYSVNLSVTNSISITGAGAGVPTYNMDFISTGTKVQQSSINQAGGVISGAITGLNNTNTFNFSLNNLNWSLPANYSWSVAPTVAISSNTSPIAGANGSATATVSGTILYTPPITGETRKLVATTVMNNAMTTYTQYTLLNDVQGPVTGQTPATYLYTVPTIVPNTGFILSGGVVVLATNPISYNVTGFQSGAGTPADPYIEVNPTVSLGTIIQSLTTLNVQAVSSPRQASVTYMTSFTNSAPTTVTLTNVNTQNTTSTGFVVGDGSITVTVNRTSPSTSSQGPGTLIWSVDGAVVGSSFSFTSGTSISESRTITGVTHNSTILVTITELGQFRQLVATGQMNAAMSPYTQYTISNNVQAVSTVGNNDPDATYATPTISPNTGYQLSGGVVSLSPVGSNGRVTYFTTAWGVAGASNDGSGQTLGSQAIENAVSVTTGVLSTETRKLDVTAYVATQISGPAEYTITNASQTINSAGLTTHTYTVPVVVPNTDYTLTGGVISLPYNPITFFVTGSQSGTGTAIDPLIENNPNVTPGTIAGIIYGVTLGYTNNIVGNSAGYTLSPVDGTRIEGIVNSAYDFGTITGTANADFQFTVGFNASYLSGLPLAGTMPSGGGSTAQTLTGTIECIPYTITLAYANSISGGTAGVEYTLSPADGSTRVGCVGLAYSFGIISATPAAGYYFSTPFNATQTAFSLPIIGTIASGGGTASQTLTGVIALARATISVVQVAVPTTTAITYATSFAPGGGGATRTLTTTGTQSLSNSAYEYGNGNVTVTVNRTAPSSTAQDGGSITWVLNGATQSTQSFNNGTTISYSRTITGVTAGDTIQVTIDEG